MNRANIVFVYGSLKREFPNHYLLREQEPLGEAIIKGTMISLKFFPGVVACGNDTIKGELYLVDDETMKRLDHLEGHPSFYKRVWVNAESIEPETSGNVFPAWCYCLPERYLQDFHYPRISEGVWKQK